MSRSLVLGNGRIMACLDDRARVRDFYFPFVGLENHIQDDNALGVGFFADGRLRWLSDPSWDISVDYQSGSLVSEIMAVNLDLKLECQIRDAIYNEKNILLRSFQLHNRADREREIRVFFNQQFTMGETTHADTAYYHPREKAVIHYKGRRVFLVSGHAEGESCKDYTIGLFKTEGREGTWRDAEDGELSRNPIEHGSVDSTMGFRVVVPAGGSARVNYWITAGETFKETQALHELVARKTVPHILTTTHDFWSAWVNKSRFSFFELEPATVELFKKSLLVMRAHCDDRGGILASGDGASGAYGRDTYGYVWPRDGVYIALALDLAGYHNLARQFFEFTGDVLTEDGYILHKYQPDRSLGSSWHPWIREGQEQLAIQEDETASLLFGLWEYYQNTKDIEFIESLYNSFIKRIADFLLSYRDEDTGLPQPSYDLWEEKYGISSYTAASVYGGLNAASRFADLLGKDADCQLYRRAAERMKDAILEYLYDQSAGYFLKQLNWENGEAVYDRTVDASSFYGIFRFGVLPAGDERLERCYSVIRTELSEPLPLGGVARYQGDQYFTVDHSLPGNSWIITTLWLTQYLILKAGTVEELEPAKQDMDWVGQHAIKSGMLSEQLNPHTGEQVSISPLAWSHAEFVRTVLEYMYKLERLGVADARRPPEQITDLEIEEVECED